MNSIKLWYWPKKLLKKIIYKWAGFICLKCFLKENFQFEMCSSTSNTPSKKFQICILWKVVKLPIQVDSTMNSLNS